MSSNGISGMSNVSSDTLQNRYEKSIKQYNKLIQINRQLKQSNNTLQSTLKDLSKQLTLLKQQNAQLDNENNLMDQKYMQLTNNYEQLQIYSKKIEEQLANNDGKLRQYDHELENQIQKCNILMRDNQYLQNQYQQCLKVVEDKETVIKGLEEENGRLVEENGKLKNLMKEENVEDMMIQLASAQANIQKLIKECNELKSRQISTQLSKQRQKVQNYITLKTNIFDQKQDNTNTISHLLHQYKAKIRQLQQQNRHLSTKSKSFKYKLKDMQKENRDKVVNLQRLTEKQQKQIQKMIETYDVELNKIHLQNRKIKEMHFELMKKINKRNERDEGNMVLELRRTCQIISNENENLKMINQSLQQERQTFIRESHNGRDSNTASFLPNVVRTQSIEVISKMPQLQEQKYNSTNIKLKYSQVENNFFENHTNPLIQQLPITKISYQTTNPNNTTNSPTGTTGPTGTGIGAAKPTSRTPINLRYTNNPDGDKSNFKFIQSVNIINGFNVNLREHTAERFNS